MALPARVSTALSRARNWIVRSIGGPSVTNLRLNWPDQWYQMGRDTPGSFGSLAFPAVYASIDVISSDIARLPMKHFKDDGESRVEQRDSRVVKVLDRPNDYQTGADMMKALIASQLFRGNGYLFPRRNRRTEINELHCLYPDHVWPQRSGSDYFYRVSAEPQADLEADSMVPPRELMHHRMMYFGDPLCGLSPMVAAATSSAAGLAILNSSARFFRKMARPSGVLQSAQRIDRRFAEEVKERWRRVYAGEEGAGDVAVLEQGLEWKPLTMTAVDAQLIDQLRYSVEDVARVYRLPLFMLGDLSKVSYNSSEQLTRIYWMGCLSAHMNSLEWRLSQFFGMDGRREYLEFDLDELFRTEMQARVEALAKAVQGGIRTPNEARRIEGLNAVPGGDKIMMQQQMWPVETLVGRTEINPSPMPGAPPVATPPREIEDYFAPDPAQLTDALMGAVFDNAPPPRPPQSYSRSVLAHRHVKRQMIYGRNTGKSA